MIDDMLLVHLADLYTLYYLGCVELSGKSGLLQLRHETCAARGLFIFAFVFLMSLQARISIGCVECTSAWCLKNSLKTHSSQDNACH
jgi:hypothetical protein